MKKPTGRRPLLAGNWKMHATRAETTALIDGIKAAAADARDRDVLIAPPFTALETAARAPQGTAKKATRKTFFFKREPFSA